MNAKKRATRQSMDDHLKKSAAQINVCLECNLAVEELLRAPPERAADDPRIYSNGGMRLADRGSWEFHVCALQYNGKNGDTLMIAARKRSFSSLEVLYAENMNEKPGKVNTRLLICKATSHRPIPRLGQEIIIFAVHGHCETMKKPTSEAYKNFYKTVKWAFEKYRPHFFLGDFNMGLLLVPSELRCRELPCDLLAYYPWRFTGDSSCSYSQTLGLDSCAIFFVYGGDVESRLNWPASHIHKLLSAGKSCGVVKSDWGVELHSYEAPKEAPGQPWWCYRCKADKTDSASDSGRNLESMLQDFLQARMSQEEWQEVKGDVQNKVGWTRFRQKQMPKESVLVDGEFHRGAHMSLIVFTDNAQCLRSAEAEAKHKQAKRDKNWEKLQARPRSMSRSSKPHWYDSSWKAGHQWSGHQWNDDPWRHYVKQSW